ncbi:MAG TPA: transglutaminase-like domain-containing protein, partial [Dehalococcoidia bacterium]|nr:transglutaminase-like domain-containing protein [Dehalococcoidia bacterium]
NGEPWLALGGAAAGTLGYGVSWRRRRHSSRLWPLLIAGLVIALSFVMRNQMLEAFTGNWLPLGRFLLLVQALSSFDLRTRGGLYTALGFSGIILFFAGQQVFNANFAIFFVLFVVLLLAFLALAFLEDGLRGAQVHWPRRQPAVIAYWTGAACAVFALSWLAFWLMPRSRDDLLGGDKVAILPFSGRSVEGAGQEIPNIDLSAILSVLPASQAGGDPSEAGFSSVSGPGTDGGPPSPGGAAEPSSDAFLGVGQPGDAPTDVVFYVRSKVISYWRGRTLDRFDGRHWRTGGTGSGLVPSEQQSGVWFDPESFRLDNQLRYSQTFFIQQDVPGALFLGYRGLRVTGLESDLSGAGLRPSVEAVNPRVEAVNPGAEGLRQGDAYRVTSAHPKFDPDELALDQATSDQRRFTALPAGSERLRELARQVTQGAETDFAKAERLAGYLAQRGELRPQQPGDLSTAVSPDEFLFEGKPGSTLDYATAMVLLSRAAGLPSRLAVGYLPGSRDPLSGTYMVRERDAHAWAEVYFAQHGWVPFDSAPRAGLALPGRGGSGVARLFRSGVGDEAFQSAKEAPVRLGQWLQRAGGARVLYALGPLLALAFLALHWRYNRRKVRSRRGGPARLGYPPLLGDSRRELRRVYAQVERLLRHQGLPPRQPWETVARHASLPNTAGPQVQEQVSWFTGAMWQAAYNPAEPPVGLVWEARRRLERLSKVLAGSRRGHSEDPGSRGQ